MSLVELRVELPAYAHSFLVTVPSTSTVSDVKQQISISCIGGPRADGQRLIWRGRNLADHEKVDELWKTSDEPRIVHLAVHPSAWSSLPPPPTISPPPPIVSPPMQPIRPTRVAPNSAVHPLTYVLFKHQAALAALSQDAPPPSNQVEQNLSRQLAVHATQRHGWIWPSVLDEEFPAATDGGLQYERVTLDDHNFLSLIPSEATPTPLQAHAFKVLSYTFTLLTIPISNTANVRPPPSQTVPLPPNVNQLLQQLGLPQMRVPQNQVPIPNPNPIVPGLREIPLRPLLAPLLLLVFRTLLLLYFVAPARKPIFGILILAWMLYEIWRPIRNGLIRGLRAAAAAENQQNQAPPNAAAAAAADAPQPPQNVPNPPAEAPRPPQNGLGGLGQANIDLHADAAFDVLANLNIETEERVLNDINNNPMEPSLSHKIGTLFSLLLTTLHPAVWNRRRVALRQREGRIRTEVNARDSPAENEGEGEGGNDNRAQIRNELREQHGRRPQWIREYMERVVAAEWVDDSD